MNIYVGNLPPKATEWNIRKLFDRFGKVGNISLEAPKEQPDLFLFCFVEMPFEKQATTAIEKLNGSKLFDYVLTVKESGLSS